MAAVLQELGAYIIDYDRLAREVVEPGREAWGNIREHFGPQILDEERRINRGKLAEIVFNDSTQRRKLEEITHPRILEAVAEREKHILQEAPQAIVVHDIPLLFEVGADRRVDATIVAYTSEENQIRRLMERNGLSRDEARARIAAQLPLEDKAEKADYIIDNNGTVEETRKQVKKVYARLLERARRS